MFSTGTQALSRIISKDFEGKTGDCMDTFWVLVARRSFAKSDEGSTVPKKIDLNWFIPALVKSKVGSDNGTTGDEGTNRDE